MHDVASAATLRPGASVEPERATRRFAALRVLRRDRVGMAGAVMVAFVVVAAVAGPLIAPADPTAIHPASRLAPPGSQFPLGTDEMGRDLLSRTLYGARVSLVVGLQAVTLAGFLGVLMGMMAGYYRGPLDNLLMRLMDIVFAFPAILLALALMAVLGTEIRNLILAITIVYVPAFARIARGSTMAVTAEPYVEAANSIGASDFWIMGRHVLPNIVAPIIVQFTVNLAYAILVEASLSFLGLGVQPPTPSWGAMLSTGKAYLEMSPWVTLWPGLAIMITVLGFNLLGDGMRDALDPRLREPGG